MNRLRLGAHMSIAGGPANALRRGHSIECDAIQMFTRNANQWRARDLTTEEVAEFRRVRAETGISPVVAHSSYLINLATPDDALWTKSLNALLDETDRCQQLGICDYVLHPGSHVGAGEEAGLERVLQALDTACEETAGSPVRVVLEITAGQGTNLGYRFEQLAWLIERAAAPERLGVCFDTAHAFAAGYDLRDEASYRATWQEFDAVIGLDQLRVIHLNDSKRELGSRVDRHEQIGEGSLGVEAFRLLVNDPALRHVPMLLETPKGEEMLEDIVNLTVLRSLIEGGTENG
ncbi:MAG: deoxyribonuclease IV [Chloroflexi bacterium]|jgi:deoxyribonuclease-4|nr:deoxyribonuclease IV [Chloroflexota bacterium]